MPAINLMNTPNRRAKDIGAVNVPFIITWLVIFASWAAVIVAIIY